MRRSYPCIEVDLNKLAHNCKTILKLCNNQGIEVVAITKGFCAKKPIVNAMVEAGIKTIGDARIQNLRGVAELNCEKYLVRIPMESDAVNVVKYSDVSLNSELKVIEKLSKAAKRAKKIHNIILMIDLGDLREGVLELDLLDTVKEILKLPNIKLIGVGTNLTCYGGVLPDEDNLSKLVELRDKLEKILDIELPIISGGNSSSLYMVINGQIPNGINQLRIGEGIILGTESSFANKIDNTFQDVFTLKGEIVEIKNKPSVPKGTIGLNAFGEEPHFEDVGIMKRAILAIGRQDIKVDAMSPRDEKIKILGASSDHLILDLTENMKDYRVGDIVDFDVKYGCLLQAMTSPYISKYYKHR
ncbi:ornithine racemase Orr [Clostridium sp. ATCC 25772]|uniref:ornithine racemase Orr n=1 Tax=Clostridium sp. ATCC 25772 TaxID=1676991 RepID=UPI0007848D7D|nr:ornithine racemase Orr [Clostridium sp. ATCC 25772]